MCGEKTNLFNMIIFSARAAPQRVEGFRSSINNQFTFFFYKQMTSSGFVFVLDEFMDVAASHQPSFIWWVNAEFKQQRTNL